MRVQVTNGSPKKSLSKREAIVMAINRIDALIDIVEGNKNLTLMDCEINVSKTLLEAKAKNFNALKNMAWFWYYGDRCNNSPFVEDREFAVQLMGKLADSGNIVMLHNYAMMLRKMGKFEEALAITQNLAGQGDLPSIARLALMHRSGNGAVKDDQLFLKYARSAASKGHFDAELMLLVYNLKNGSLIDRVKALLYVPVHCVRQAISKAEDPNQDVHLL